jgi:haloalkane dehalogenase
VRTIPAWLDREAYPFAHRWLKVADGELHYIDEGAGGTPMLFVHGTPTWSFEWRHLVRALSPSNRSIALDHLGFGLSDRPMAVSYTPEAHARRLAEFVRGLGLSEVVLVVHDFGGPIAFPLALEDTLRVRKLVVINSWMWPLDDDPDMRRKARVAGGAFGRFLYRYANASLRVIMPSAYGDRSRLTPPIYAQYLAPFPDVWSRGAVLWPLAHALLGSTAFYRSLWERRDRLAQTPSLIVWGMRDSAFQPKQLARWRTALPKARVIELPAGHWPHEEMPNEVSSAVRDFVGV